MIEAPPTTTTDQSASEARSAIRRIVVFVALIMATGLVGRWIDGTEADAASPGPGALLWLVAPLVIAAVIARTAPRSLPWGLRPNLRSAWPWYLLAAGIFPMMTLILVGAGRVADTLTIAPNLALGTVLAAMAVALPASLIKNMFEELAWRGYLVTELVAARVSKLTNHLTVGAIWGAWHLPYLDTFAETYHDLDWTIYVPLFLIGVLVTAIIYGEIRLRSGTVWPAVIMHATANATANTLFFEDHIALDRAWLISPAIDNIGYIVLATAIAALLITAKPRHQRTLN